MITPQGSVRISENFTIDMTTNNNNNNVSSLIEVMDIITETSEDSQDDTIIDVEEFTSESPVVFEATD